MSSSGLVATWVLELPLLGRELADWLAQLDTSPELIWLTISEGSIPRSVPNMAGLDAMATLIPLTDAVHRIDGQGLVAKVIDRDNLGYLGFPQLVRVATITQIIDRAGPNSEVNPAAETLREGGQVGLLS